MGEKQYEIALSPKIYSMMSDKLYTDRIGSVVREVCSNAWDAQKMKSLATGEPMESFTVTLPTDLEPHFVVEDTGPGMPDEVAQRLYRTLGLSTKEDTNDQIGAFGLGSKSPFAVTDTFTVENTHEGITYFYLCFKAENGLPSLLPTGQRNEGRKDGVKVIIPAPGHKYHEYKKALHRQLIVMEPKPIIGNLEQFDFFDAVKMAETPEGFILSNATDFGLNQRGVYARMGMVIYPVDYGQLGFDYYAAKIHERIPYNSALILNFDIGDLEPLPSREGLTYDEKTKKNIRNKYKLYGDTYVAIIVQDIKNQPTPLDAWLKWQELRKLNIDMSKHEKDLYVQGFPIDNGEITNVFPTFQRTYDKLYPYAPIVYAKTNDFDDEDLEGEEEDTEIGKTVTADGEPLIDVEGKKYVKRPVTVTEGVYEFELFERSDLRLNKKRERQMFKVNFHWLHQAVKKGFKFFLYDETDPKYRIGRVKSVLKQLGYSQSCFVVHVNEHSKKDRTDFSEFVECLERLRPGLSKEVDIVYLSKVPRPEIERREKEDDGILYGLTTGKRHSKTERKNLRWSDITSNFTPSAPPEDEEAFEEEYELKKAEFVKDAFYVRMNRNELVNYPSISQDTFFQYSMSGYNVFFVRKTGEGHIADLEELGIQEFGVWVEDRLKDYVPSDDYKKYNSAKKTIEADKYWFGAQKGTHLRQLKDELELNNEYIHPYLNLRSEIARLGNLSNGVLASDANTKLIDRLRGEHLVQYFPNSEWHKNLEIDVAKDYQEFKDSFLVTYPLIALAITHADVTNSVNMDLYKYMVDYNALNNLGTTFEQEEQE